MNIKTYIIFLLLFFLSLSSALADEYDAANFLAQKWVLVDQSSEPKKYNIKSKITRKEFISIIINLSWGTTKTKCEFNFNDVINDWGCKYIDEAYERGLIEKNEKFRPEKNISRGEALGLIFKALKLESQITEPWQKGYFEAAIEQKLMSEQMYLYNFSAKRWWIFDIVANTDPEYTSWNWIRGWSPASSVGSMSKSNEDNLWIVTKNLEWSQLQGAYIEYFDNWNVKLQSNYIDGQLHGESVWYYYNGSLNFKWNYKTNRLEWEYVKYYAHWKLAFKEYYYKWLLNGVCEYYDESWLMVKKREYIWGYMLREF